MIKSVYELIVTMVFIGLVALLIFGGLSNKFDPYQAHYILLSQDLSRTLELASISTSYIFVSFTPTLPEFLSVSQSSVKVDDTEVSSLLLDNSRFFSASVQPTGSDTDIQAVPLTFVSQPVLSKQSNSQKSQLTFDKKDCFSRITISSDVLGFEDLTSELSSTLTIKKDQPYSMNLLVSNNPQLICFMIETFMKHSISLVYDYDPMHTESTLYLSSYPNSIRDVFLRNLHTEHEKLFAKKGDDS
jgi:hypothetical protein